MLVTLVPTASLAAEAPTLDEIVESAPDEAEEPQPDETENTAQDEPEELAEDDEPEIPDEEVERPGIGTVEASVPLPPLPSMFALAGQPFEYQPAYYRQQLDEDSQAVYDALLASPLWNGPVETIVKLDISKWPSYAKTVIAPVHYDGKVDKFFVSPTKHDVATLTSVADYGVAAVLMDHPEMSWLVNTGLSTVWSYDHSWAEADPAVQAQKRDALAKKEVVDLGTRVVPIAYMNLKFNEESLKKATVDDSQSGVGGTAQYDFANTGDRKAIENAVQAAVSSIGDLSGQSTADKVDAIHKWVCDTVTYATKSNNPRFPLWRGYQTAYTALVDPQITVCAGYAKSMKLLCDQYGVPCVVVYGQSGVGEPHAWNYVEVDGKWYGVDATWGDQKTGISKNHFLKGSDSFEHSSIQKDRHISGTAYGQCVLIYPTLNKWDYEPHTHVKGSLAQGDDHHWYVCTGDGCEEKLEVAAHQWNDGIVTTPATEEAPGERTYACTVCGKTTTESIDVLEHKCVAEGDWETDEDAHWHNCRKSDCPKRVDEAPHIWDSGKITVEPTEAEEGVRTFTCTVCGETKTESVAKIKHQHAADPVWQKDETGHWHNCKPGCLEQLNKAAHTWDNGTVTTPPTEDEQGIRTFTCTVCKHMRTEPVAALPHTHVWDTKWQKDSTNHWHECSKATCQDKTAVAAHAWNAGVITKPATEQADGLRTLKCTVCGQTKTEKIRKLQHQAGTMLFSDEETHWNRCTNPGCSLKMNEAKHTLDAGTVALEPTESDAGLKEFTCTVCGKKLARTTSPLSHEHAWATNWTTDDFEHWHECTAPACGTADNTKDVAAHTMMWTTTQPATTEAPGVETGVCSICMLQTTREIPQLEKHEHVWNTNLASDALHHWFECTESDCDAVSNAEKQGYGVHTWDYGTVTVQPTTTTSGVRTYKCTAATCTATKAVEIPAFGSGQDAHSHSWAADWSYDADNHWLACTEPGCTLTSPVEMTAFAPHVWYSAADTVCSVCGATRAVGVEITYDANGGTMSATTQQTKPDGKLAYLPTAVREGYAFTGWFTAPDGGDVVTTSMVFTAPTTVYAQWMDEVAIFGPSPEPSPSEGDGSETPSSTPSAEASPSEEPATQTDPAGQTSASPEPTNSDDPVSTNNTGTDPGAEGSTDPAADDAPLQPAPDAEVLFEIAQSDHPEVDGNILSGIPIAGPDDADAATVEKLIASIKLPEGAELQIMNSAGAPAYANERVGTGYVLTVVDADGNEISRATVIVMGDVLGIGRMNLTQLVKVAQGYTGSATLDGAYKLAALHTGNKKLTLTDVVIQAGMYLDACGGQAA